MNRDIVWTSQFKKDYKLAMKRNKDMSLIDDCIRKLAAREELPPQFRDHDLSGNWAGHRESHALCPVINRVFVGELRKRYDVRRDCKLGNVVVGMGLRC